MLSKKWFPELTINKKININQYLKNKIKNNILFKINKIQNKLFLIKKY